MRNSKGMLADVNGSERVLSVGTGHTAAFCRAANAGCKTNISSIKDNAGVIDLAKLKRQPGFKQMLEIGWDWTVLPARVEVSWPSSPDILQRALNSSHEVHSSATELEVAVTIAECIESGATVEEAIAIAVSGNPPCAAYVSSLATLASLFGGGNKVPMLHALDSFAKRHGENRRLGEEFLSAIVTLKFPEDAVFPRVIDSLLAANLVSQKVVDGVARSITKTDVSAISSKPKVPLVKEAEAHLAEANRICEALRQQLTNDIDELDNVEGLFKVRIGAHVCGKGKTTFEGVAHKDMRAIVRLFLHDVFELVKFAEQKIDLGSIVTLHDTWVVILSEGGDDALPVQGQTEVGKTVGLLSLDELTDKPNIADRRGFKVGTLVFERGHGPRQGMYAIESIGDDVVLNEHDAFKESHLKMKLAFEQFIAKWAPFKGDVPEKIDANWGPWCVWNTKSLSIDAVKCELIVAMQSYALENASGDDDLVLCIKPSAVRAKQDIAKGELVLVPCGGISSINTGERNGSIDLKFSRVIGGKEVKFYVSRSAQTKEDFKFWKADETINPCFWVTTTGVEKEANIVTKRVANYKGVSFVVFTNSRAVAKMGLLQTYKPVVVPVPLAGATSVTADPTELPDARARGRGRGRVSTAAKPASKRARGRGN